MLKCRKTFNGIIGDRFRFAEDGWRGSIYFIERVGGSYKIETTDNKATTCVINRLGRMFDTRHPSKSYPQWNYVTRDEINSIISGVA